MDFSNIRFPKHQLLKSTNRHWDSLSNEGKRMHLQEWENFWARLHGRPPCEVQFTRIHLKNNESGGLDRDSGVIYIHFDSDYYEKLKTLFHESRHAYQWEVVCGRIKHDNAEEVEKWKREFATGNNNPVEHARRSVEKDAYRFEEDVLDELWTQRAPLLTGREEKDEKLFRAMAKQKPLAENIEERAGNPLVYSQKQTKIPLRIQPTIR